MHYELRTVLSNAQNYRAAALDFTQPFHGRNNSGSYHVNWPVAIHFGKTAQGMVVFDDRSGLGGIGAHALRKDFFRIVSSLDQSRTLYIANAFHDGAAFRKRCRWSGRQDNSCGR